MSSGTFQKLNQKKALVIGGSRGIGASIVERFTQEGANVAFTYMSAAENAIALSKKTGAKAAQIDSKDYPKLCEFIDGLGALDILVVVAGAFVMGNPLDIESSVIDDLIDLNVRSPYHACVQASRKMSQGGRIIIIGSVNADRMPMAGASAYALTKSAIQGLVKGLARDLGDRGITVNNIQPGPTDTDMNPGDGPMSDAMHSFMAIKRHVNPSEVAGMALYLAGDEAEMVTGAQHTIDGGFGA